MKGRVSSVGRLRDFINKSDDEPLEASEGGGYYQSASALWHNRGKIFENIKKQGFVCFLKNASLCVTI